MKTAQNEVADLKSKLEGLKAIELENKKLNGVVAEKEKEVIKVKEAIEKEKDEKMDLLQVCPLSLSIIRNKKIMQTIIIHINII